MILIYITIILAVDRWSRCKHWKIARGRLGRCIIGRTYTPGRHRRSIHHAM